MTRWLEISAAADPVERVVADVAVIGLFTGERPLRGNAGRADWRLCGRLSGLIAAGGLAGAEGEALLIPSGGGLLAPLVVALGWGERERFDVEVCREAVRDGVERALRLRAETIALGLPGPESLPLEARLTAALAGAGDVQAPKAVPGEAAVRLRLLAVADERPAVADWLRGALDRPLPGGVCIERPGPEARPRAPRGTRGTPVPARRPLVK